MYRVGNKDFLEGRMAVVMIQESDTEGREQPMLALQKALPQDTYETESLLQFPLALKFA